MTFKVAVGAGHGGKGSTPGKRDPDGNYEWTYNDKVVDAFIAELNNYEGVEVRRMDDVSGNTDVSLSKRTTAANAWDADIYVSFHQNALAGKWGTHGGTETFYYEGSAKSRRLAELLHKANVKAYGLTDRGLKRGNHLYILNQTSMPSALVEGGFMDSTIDIKKLRDDNVLRNAGIYSAQAVAEYAGLKRKATNGWSKQSGKWYYYENGRHKTGWLKYKNDWYYLGADGVMATGWTKVNSKWYFMDVEGAMKTGWLKYKNDWYFLRDSGAMATGWITDKGKYYYLNPNGDMASDTEVQVKVNKDGSALI